MKKDEEVIEEQPQEISIEPEEVEEEHDDCKDQITALESEVAKLKNMYLTALADYKNQENRMKAERQEMKDRVKKQVVEELLPVLDLMNQAEMFLKDPGLQMVSKSFQQALAALGVKEADLLGSEYDPYTAEVIEVVEGKEDNIVVDVLQKAYTLNNSIIRPGKVKVSKVTDSEKES